MVFASRLFSCSDGGGWTMKPMHITHWCSLWKSSRVGWERFVSHVPFEVEDGGNVRFCHDGGHVRYCLFGSLKREESRGE